MAYDDPVDLAAIERRLTGMSPATNAAFSLGLAALACLQVWGLGQYQAGGFARPDAVAYVLAAGAFVPLIVRHGAPAFALAAAGGAALAYIVLDYPSAFVVAGPMIAMYSLAVYGRRFVSVFVALLGVGLVVATLAFTISGVEWMTEAGGTFALLCAAAFAGAIQRSRRAYLAAVEERIAEAEHSREEEALRRAEAERLRIAREVHDVVAHTLSVVIVQSNAALQLLERDPGRAREAVEAIAGDSRRALNELRSTLRMLRTGEVAPRRPAPNLTRLDELLALARDAGIAVECDVDGALDGLPGVVSASAYRIVQEAVTNVLRHAGATRLSVRIGLRQGDLALRVLDDGRGARASEGADDDRPGGHGLAGMRERVAALGGSLSTSSPQEGGFEVRALIPVKGGPP
jgi:signal transduction histidine kinase